MEDAYEDYDAWKGWGAERFMVLPDRQRAYYAEEFRGIPVAGERVLEIGFGSGTLLAWLKEAGAEVAGTELSQQGAALARERGIPVLEADLRDVHDQAGSFGVIAAFDVLEHLSMIEIRELFDKAATLLHPGGYFIARFPNGGSPFARSIQHGDVTHISTLTISKIVQLLQGKPFRIVRAGDTASARYGGPLTRAARVARDGAKSLFERGLKTLYGLHDVPMHPNLTIVLQRSV